MFTQFGSRPIMGERDLCFTINEFFTKRYKRVTRN